LSQNLADPKVKGSNIRDEETLDSKKKFINKRAVIQRLIAGAKREIFSIANRGPARIARKTRAFVKSPKRNPSRSRPAAASFAKDRARNIQQKNPLPHRLCGRETLSSNPSLQRLVANPGGTSGVHVS
jgi:hypothetical protein